MINGGENNANQPQYSITKVCIAIISLSGIITFLGMLPKITPYVALTPSAFSLPFPKIWVLLTATFYHENVLSALFEIIIFVLIAKQVEPLMGSKELLRMFIMFGYYTNILVLFFAAIIFLITGNYLILNRTFITSSAPIPAMVVWLAHEFIDLKVPTMCGNMKVRLIPFYSFMIQLIFSLIGTIDSLLTSVISYVLAYLYIRYIKRNGRTRGDPSFSPLKLIPSCCSFNDDDDDDDDNNNNDQGVPPMGFGAFQQPTNTDGGGGGGADRFRYDNGSNQRNNNNQNRNRFQGSPHTVGQ